MDLKINDVADLLNVSESTVSRWVADRKIPFYEIKKQLRFSRTEIQDWMISHRNRLGSPSEDFSLPAPNIKGNNQFSLYRAIHKGEVFHTIKGETKEEIIRNTMKKAAKPLGVDAEIMTDLLMDREMLSPTALNHGIAVPHTRDSLFASPYDAVITVFLDQPIEYGALDGKPVHTLFFLFASEDRRHLNLLSKIAHLSHQPESLAFFLARPEKETLLNYIKEWEGQIQTKL